jgi:GNAT superfamily N-acetyltransferase
VDRFETVDGILLTVRPISSDDKSALLDAFRHLSQRSVYRRFLAPVKTLTESELAYLTELDHTGHEALVAVAETGEIVGVARYVRDPEDRERAEAAVTVLDDWQGRGVGTACSAGSPAGPARTASATSPASAWRTTGRCSSSSTSLGRRSSTAPRAKLSRWR